jgi:glycosyltransferase involved in cell wall biosynthesis
MEPVARAITQMVLLIGNYPPDQQQSMQRFATMMLQGLHAAGVAAELMQPEPVWGGKMSRAPALNKILGYVYKFIVFPRRLKSKCASRPAIVHICDHSNAMYATAASGIPTVVTCHDLLAVRSALGESTDCRVSATGRFLQRWILRSLRRVSAIACVSGATLNDLRRLLGPGRTGTSDRVVALGLSFPYRRIPPAEVAARLATIKDLDPARPFVLHVGSNLVRKNRDGVLRIFARASGSWDAQLVVAGNALSPELNALARAIGVASAVVNVPDPPNELLEALYNGATALLFPSTFEGFGWPIAEAQACGCPVICSDIEPFQEVTAGSALMRDVRDEDGFAEDLLRLRQPEEREQWAAKSLRNAERFSTGRMIDGYVQLYRTLAPQL